MGILFYIGIIVLALIVIITIIGYLLPKTAHIERWRKIAVEPDVLFHEVADFERFVTWSPWSEKDPTMKQTFEGEKLAVGSKYSWKGNRKVGEGSMEIMHIEANEKIVMDLNFGPRGLAKCTFTFEPVDGGTKMSWQLDSDLGNNPTSRIFGALMDKFVGNDFEEGLENLARKTEKQ